MKAIILAAGYGNRMRPLTDNQHKTLLKINNFTILDNIIDSLINNSVNDIVIVTGYRNKELQKYLSKNYSKISFQYVHNKEYKTTNNIYSLSLAFQQIKIDSDIILIESDLIYNHKIINKLINSNHENLALIDKYHSGMDGTVVKLGSDMKIIEVIPPHLQDSNFDFSNKYKTLNIYKFSMNFTNNIFSKLLNYYSKAIDDNCYYELILGILIYMQKESIYGLLVNNKDWIEVDDTNDIRIAEYKFSKNKKKEILEKSWGGYWNYGIVDFSFIRNMYFPPPSMIADIKNNFEDLIWNYGSSNKIMNKKLSYFLLLNEKYLIALNGAAQIYPTLKSMFFEKKALLPKPTFGEYDKIFKNKSYFGDQGKFDLKEIKSAISRNDVIVFVNPNNPTGSLIESSKLLDIIKKFPTKFFIIDESFIEFSDSKSFIYFIDDFNLKNVLVLTSMSKSYGFPGVRLGYAYSRNNEVLSSIKDAIPIWNFNSIAEYSLEIMLKYRNEYDNSIKKTIKDRNHFIIMLKKQKWIYKVFQSEANFIIAETSPKLINIIEKLLNDSNIYIRDVSSKFNDNKVYFRFAVRLPDENKLLIDTIENILKKH